MQQSLKAYLSEIKLLSEDEINYSLSFFVHSKLEKDEFFIKENEVCDKVGFIVNGAAKAFSLDSNGSENIICFKFENQFITSYESLILKQNSKKSIRAIEDCDILTLNQGKLASLLTELPSWQFVSKAMVEQELIDKENYRIDFSNKSAKEKYLQVLANSPEIVRRVKVQDLSSYLGITQRTLTRVKKEIMQSTFF